MPSRVSDSIPGKADPENGVGDTLSPTNTLVGIALSPLVDEEAEDGLIRNHFKALANCTEEIEVESLVSKGEENMFIDHLMETVRPSIIPLQISEPRITRRGII